MARRASALVRARLAKPDKRRLENRAKKLLDDFRAADDSPAASRGR